MDVVLAVSVILATVKDDAASLALLVREQNLEVESLLVQHLALQQDVGLHQTQVLFAVLQWVLPLSLWRGDIDVPLGRLIVSPLQILRSAPPVYSLLLINTEQLDRLAILKLIIVHLSLIENKN